MGRQTLRIPPWRKDHSHDREDEERELEIRSLSQFTQLLTTIYKEVRRMANGLEDLKAAITDLATHVAAEKTAIDALVAALEAEGQAEDFSEEIAALNAARDNVQAGIDEATAAVTPAPEPTPEPTPEPGA